MFRKFLAVTILVLIATFCFAQDMRPDIDPVVQGTWFIQWTSDEGTMDGSPICKVYGDRVVMLDAKRTTMYVQNVAIIKDKMGYPGNLVQFSNGTWWGITKPPQLNGMVLVQVLKFPTGEETYRFSVTVGR